MDTQILAVQKWLNQTYGPYAGWVTLLEDGRTGWETIYGLRRGLQHELGISPMSSGFGPATTAAFQEQIGVIDASSDVGENIYRLVSGSLWCKGISGVPTGGTYSFSSLSSGIQTARNNLGIGDGPTEIDVKLMASLMSMDAYWIPESGGSESVREVQQWLNATYSSRRDFALIPADGNTSRQVITATLYAIQYEIGMADGVANGNFGPGTRDGIRSSATVSLGSSDSDHHYVRLFSGLLRLNGFEGAPFSSFFSVDIQRIARQYQNFMELPATGAGDYSTWCSLFVSCGDTDVDTRGFDTSTRLTSTTAGGAVTAGYTHVGRYLVGANQFITASELSALKSEGLRLFPIMQRFNNTISTMTYDAGVEQAADAIERARVLDLPDGATIFYAVDFDPTIDQIVSSVSSFFLGINSVHNSVLCRDYKVGVYGTRNVCRTIIGNNLATSAFVAGMSWGWSGNMGVPMPEEWGYNQIVETREGLGGVTVGLDKVVVSSSAPSINLAEVTPPPVDTTGEDPYGTGFDQLYSWAVGAELAAEIASSGHDSLPTQQQINRMVLGWLRKPTYWKPDSEGGILLWQTYTPEGTPEWRDDVEAALELRSDHATIKTATSERDNMHFAAACLGCLLWYSPADPPESTSPADLGGWALDLLQVWGQYEREGGGESPYDWLLEKIGAKDVASSFGYADLVADADAWLIGRELSNQPDQSLSRVLRSLHQQNASQRVAYFFSERFASSRAVLSNLLSSWISDLRSGRGLATLSAGLIRQAAGISQFPDDAQVTACVDAFSDAIERL